MNTLGANTINIGLQLKWKQTNKAKQKIPAISTESQVSGKNNRNTKGERKRR